MGWGISSRLVADRLEGDGGADAGIIAVEIAHDVAVHVAIVHEDAIGEVFVGVLDGEVIDRLTFAGTCDRNHMRVYRSVGARMV